MKKNFEYQWEACAEIETPEKNISSWENRFGPTVTERFSDGKAKKVLFQLLVENKKNSIYLVGDFNKWESDVSKLAEYKLNIDADGTFASLELEGITHKDGYKFKVVGDDGSSLLQDPAGVYFDDKGNSIFWDYEDPSSYKQKNTFIDTRDRTTKILQTDLPGLIVHWADKKGVLGQNVSKDTYFKFIAESGVIPHIKELGFNTVQFLPFAQSIDGDNWKYSYLVPFQFAIQKNWGTPDDFAYMVDMFHKNGIAVIGDFVIGHMPHKDYGIFGLDSKDNGIHTWKRESGAELYLGDETSWGTKRPCIYDENVRGFLVSSVLHFMKRYAIDGVRVDNVDGILRYGESGDGDERPHSRYFLRELNQAIYSYNPRALIHFEAHYFFEDNAKMLVIPFDQDDRALGATAYNSSRLTYYLHTEYMLKSVEKTSVWKFRDIISEKEYGQSNSTVADFHNHDAAAGLMAKRATGSYAYDTMTCKQPENHLHALGKIKVMEAIISLVQEGRTLDLVQSLLLQTGTFEHDSSIHWQLTFTEVSRNMLQYKKAINDVMDAPAFWPKYVDGRSFLNLDEENKVLVVERHAIHDGKESRYVVVINISSWRHLTYRVGVRTKKKYKVVLNSDEYNYAGGGLASYGEELESQKSNSFELLDREVVLPVLAPYGVVVLKEIDD